ncbi:MAG: chitinase [Chloroflexota bacterium]|jgi:chitinase|nr:chitinase [Chloroflexota bacterium]
MRKLSQAVGALVACAVLCVAGGSVSAASPARVVVGYYANSDVYDRDYFPSDIAATKFTHLNYAFGKPTSAGKCALTDPAADYTFKVSAARSVNGTADTNSQKLRGNFNQLKQLKAANPGLKVLISIGGWTLSRYFSDIASTAAGRQAFARSCISLFLKGNLPMNNGAGGAGVARNVFDGIDIDWEFPVEGGLPGNHYRPADRHNATLLFKEFRKQLDTYGDARGRHFLLTAALPSGDVANGRYELAAVGATLDWINVMTYDMHGPWDPTTDFDSPFQRDPADGAGSAAYTVKGSIAHFRGHGVPASKLVVGVPFYAYQYTGVDSTDNGLYRPFDNAALDGSGNWSTLVNPTYHDLVDIGGVVTSPSSGTPVGQSGFSRHVSTAAAEPWLWNPSMHGGTFITYEDRQSIADRVAYVKAQGLHGLMAWEISQDSDDHDLAKALAKVRP